MMGDRANIAVLNPLCGQATDAKESEFSVNSGGRALILVNSPRQSAPLSSPH